MIDRSPRARSVLTTILLATAGITAWVIGVGVARWIIGL